VSIGDKVRATRKAAGISQEEVARRAGVSLNVINRLERGVILDPHYSTLRGIARALGVPVEDLVREPALASFATPGKAEAPAAGPAKPTETPEPLARIPYEPEKRAEARKEALRILKEADETGEFRLDHVTIRDTGEALELQYISSAEKDPFYGPWLEYVNKFADRWEQRIATLNFDGGAIDEFIGILDDLQPVLQRLGRQEKLQKPQESEHFTYGPTIGWAIRRIHDLVNPLIVAGTKQFGENDLARLRRRRDELLSVQDLTWREQKLERRV